MPGKETQRKPQRLSALKTGCSSALGAIIKEREGREVLCSYSCLLRQFDRAFIPERILILWILVNITDMFMNVKLPSNREPR